jgi:hypothetical protein
MDRKLVAGGAAFVALTLGTVWYQFSRIPLADARPQVDDLRWGWLVLLLLGLPVESLASGLRIWVIARVLQPGIGFSTCLKAEWANAAVSLLTPSQSGGGPGQIYMLSRAGARAGTALTISLISFAGTMAGLLALGLYSLFVSHAVAGGPLVATAVWSLAAIAGVMTLAAACPGAIRAALRGLSRAIARLTGKAPDRLLARLLDLVDTYRRDVLSFVRRGKAAFAAVCALSLCFLLARAVMPYLCLRFLGLDTWTLRHVVEAQAALIFLVFFAPTPGGAGLAEGASLALMAPAVPVGFAPYYTLLWRSATVYVAALAGLLCLARAAIGDARHVVCEGRILA